MAESTTISSSNNLWGSSSYSSSTDLKVGKTGSTSSDGTKYRGRVTFGRLPQNVIITSVTLSMKRIDDYSAHTLNVGSSSSGTWGASQDWDKDISVSAGTGTKSWNLTAYASALQSYTGNWYQHIRHGSGTNSYTEFSGSSPTLVVEYMLPTSGPSVSSGSVGLGSGVVIYTNRTNSSYLHTLSYSFGGTSGTIASSVGDSVTWYPALSLAAQLPNATSGSCTITCDTYYSGVLTGTKTCTLTLTVPSSVMPSIGSVSISEAVSGLAAEFGAFIQNKSKVNVSIPAYGAQGSTITSYRATLAGTTYTAASFTSGVLTTAGSNTLSITVTDSRGRSASASYNVSVTAYSPPSITSFLAARCNSAGTAAQIDGTRMWYTLAAAASSMGNRNTMACTVQYKLKSAQTWTTAVTVSHSNYTINQVNVALPSGIVFNTQNSYDLQVTVTDYFGSVTAAAGLATKQVVFDVLADGTGMGIGKIAEAVNTQDIGWALRQATPLPVTSGGTGQTTLQALRNSMGLGNTSGTLPVANGGTGQTSLAALRNDMGLGNTTGALPVTNGGTGQTSLALARSAMGLGNTTGAQPVANGGTNATTASAALQNLGVQMGTVSVSVPGTSNADAVAYFSPAFSSVPRIVVFTIFREDSATSQNLSTGYLVAKTASYFIARQVKTSGTTSTFTVNWIAIQ